MARKVRSHFENKQDIEQKEYNKLNNSPLHWTSKPGVLKGRMLGDLSNRKSGTSINCAESKLLAESMYGQLSYPTIQEIISA